MGGVNVYELDPKNFQLVRHISAERARWEASLKTWVFENGWRRDFSGECRAMSRTSRPGEDVRELTEPPDYFLKEVKQDKQMNFQELAATSAICSKAASTP